VPGQDFIISYACAKGEFSFGDFGGGFYTNDFVTNMQEAMNDPEVRKDGIDLLKVLRLLNAHTKKRSTYSTNSCFEEYVSYEPLLRILDKTNENDCDFSTAGGKESGKASASSESRPSTDQPSASSPPTTDPQSPKRRSGSFFAALCGCGKKQMPEEG